MTEQENELLEMYIRYIKKRNLIIFIIVFIVVVFCIFGFYKIKSISNNVEESNLIEEVIVKFNRNRITQICEDMDWAKEVLLVGDEYERKLAQDFIELQNKELEMIDIN